MKKTLNERFVDIADWVSSAMGTPVNIVMWILAVLIWILIFAINPNLQNTSFLPAWFTSNSFNFPLNTVTTLAELYIGFLVAAAANRVEKHNRELQENQVLILRHIEQLINHEEEELKQFEQETKQERRTQVILERLEAQDAELLKQTNMLIDLIRHAKGKRP